MGSTPIPDKVLIGTVRRSIPVTVWRDILGDLMNGYVLVSHDQSTYAGDIDADSFGFQFTDGGYPIECEELYHYWPESESKHIGKSQDKDSPIPYQVGGFRVGDVSNRRRKSVDPIRENCADDRAMRNRNEFGPLPYAKWDALMDTANTTYGKHVTGKAAPPKTKEEYNIQMMELGVRPHLMCV